MWQKEVVEGGMAGLMVEVVWYFGRWGDVYLASKKDRGEEKLGEKIEGKMKLTCNITSCDLG